MELNSDDNRSVNTVLTTIPIGVLGQEIFTLTLPSVPLNSYLLTVVDASILKACYSSHFLFWSTRSVGHGVHSYSGPENRSSHYGHNALQFGIHRWNDLLNPQYSYPVSP